MYTNTNGSQNKASEDFLPIMSHGDRRIFFVGNIERTENRPMFGRINGRLMDEATLNDWNETRQMLILVVATKATIQYIDY